ncbi:WD40-like Beta Propeller Repeat [Prevotella sp. tc2-28]|uniref:PorE family type IX secretion system protein n=1 Tax=Prevotella sp. tc2-28 TaxID=1761888 RepID=UPI000896416E|nr:OmpA family protein [Prevotella sp. tc2-28]SDZ93948.1 WD40-like Beta Propeller Repeat [Prevotella sp. tc2-28]
MKRNLHLIIYIILSAMLLTGCGADQALKKGDKFYALGEYYDASTKYRKAYSQTPAKERVQRGRIALKMAECYRRINYTQKAIAAYNNAIRYKQTDSLTQLRLGQQLMKNGNYKEAAKAFQTFIDSADIQQQAANIQLARTGLRSAQQAPEWKKQGSDYTAKRENLFNSRRADYSPMLAGDDSNQLFFTSTRNQAKGDELSGITGTKNADIFYSQKDENGKWQRPEAIDTELNTDFDEGACSFSPDARTMYLTQCKTDPDYPRYATIVTSQRSDAAWSKAVELQLTRDTLSAYAHPAVSPDGQWLYFSSNMPGGMGGYDIWRVRLTTSGVGGVENVGSPINTPGDEFFPTFRPNGDLYFSSDGHEGMGGLDIYIARQQGNGYTISHPGFPLNSQGDDFGMTFEGMKNQGFFSSNRGDGKGWDHIYSFYNPEIIQTVKGWVYEQDGYELTQAVVYMVGNDGTNLKLSVKGDGSFTQEIKAGVDYVLLGTCKGFLNHQEHIKVEPVKKSEEYVLQFPLASITAPVLIDNIFYDFDKATLRPESAAALDQLVALLKENPNVTIELSAHTDYKGSSEYNKRLSQRRAESVVKYLAEHGIENDRLTPVGYGKEQPKLIRKKVAERYPFLKENDVLTEAYIKTLKDDEQEQCNQLNRRTEFRVLRTTYGLFPKK